MATFGFIGCGNMGGALAHAVCKTVPADQVFLTNRTVEKAKALAEELGCFFVDIATPMKDENGFLRSEYCSDAYCHLSIEGAAVWERALKDFLLEHKGEFA